MATTVRGTTMPLITSNDGTRLYCEEAGTGTPVVFVHEFAGDYRTWEPQMRYFSRSHRCVTLFRARLSAFRCAHRSGALRTGVGARRCYCHYGRARHRAGACGRPFHGRIYRAACRPPSPATLHLGDGGRLRLGLGGRSGGARGDAEARAGECEAVHRKDHAGGRRDLCRYADAAEPQVQGPARLCRICPHAFGALRAGPRFDDVDAAGAGVRRCGTSRPI